MSADSAAVVEPAASRARPESGDSWRANLELLGNASSLVATTGVTSALGFGYWAVAARLFSQEAVGYGSAAVSAMTVLGTIGMFGMGTVLIAELPKRQDRGSLVSAGLIVCGLGSGLLGLGFGLVAPHVSSRFEAIVGTPEELALLTVGVLLTGVTLVFDQATIGLLRGGVQLTRNFVFSLGKLLVLPIAAIAVHSAVGTRISLSWVAGMALSLLAIAVWLRLTGTRLLRWPDLAMLRKLRFVALAHNWLNLAIAVPPALIPILVTVVVSPAANGAFYAAWTLVGFLYMIPTHLSTVLFAVASGDPRAIARKLRFTLRVSVLIGLPGMAVLALGAHFILGLFGAGYAAVATVPLRLLVLCYVPAIPRVHYIAVCRAQGKVSRAAVVMTAAAAVEVASVVVAGSADGLAGVTLALVLVFLAEAALTSPTVIKAALGAGRHRCPAQPGQVADPERAGPAHRRTRSRTPGVPERTR